VATDPVLRRLALRTLLGAFPGPTPPRWALDLIDQGLAGYTLFGYNVTSPEQLAATSHRLRAGCPDVLLAIDEEGGDVTRLAHATGSPYPGNAALGAVDDPALTTRIYRAIGDELAATGINLDLAPTVDVNTADDNPIIGTRSFGAEPALVARHSAAAVTGLQAAGVAACAKHFPGHGATLSDSHLELPTVAAPLEVLRARDLPPFAAAIAAGVQSIMTAHIRLPALTGDVPATFSRAALVDLLRGEWGFTGAVITDALEMRGAGGTAGGVPEAAVRALAAGADLLCIGANVGADLIEAVAARIAEAVDAGLPVRRVEEAAERTAALAAWTRAAGSAAPGPTNAGSTHAGFVDGPSGIGYAAASRAVRVEGSPAGFGSALVVHLAATPNLAEGRVPWGLGPHSDAAHLRVVAAESSAEALVSAAAGRPIVLVGRHLHRSTAARALVEDVAGRHPVAVVEMGWPSAWRVPGARAFVITHGASHANGHAAARALGLPPRL
jgi:beta-N-acetylhexosaminidase